MVRTRPGVRIPAEAWDTYTAVAQLAERWSPKPEVGGSIPSRRADGKCESAKVRKCESAKVVGSVRLRVPSFNGQDTGLSLRRSGFDSPWHRSVSAQCQVPSPQCGSVQFPGTGHWNLGTAVRGHSSAGRARLRHGRGRGFESRCPLHTPRSSSGPGRPVFNRETAGSNPARGTRHHHLPVRLAARHPVLSRETAGSNPARGAPQTRSSAVRALG